MRTEKKVKKTKETPFAALTSVFLFLAVTVCLLFTGRDYTATSEAKFRCFAVVGIAYIAAFFILGAELILVGKLKLPKFSETVKKTSWADRIALVYLALTWISALASPYFPKTVIGASRYNGALTVTVYVVSFILISHFGRADKFVLVGLSAATTAQNLLAIIQLSGRNPLSLYPDGMTYYDAGTLYSGEHLGTLGNVDLLAAFYCAAIPFFLYLIIRGKEKTRFWLFVPLASSVYVLVSMHVLAGYVGTLAGVLLMLPIALPISRKKRKILAVCLALLLVLGLLTVFFADIGTGFLHEVHEVMHGNADDSFGSGRIRIWRDVLARTRGHLMLGNGPDTMIFADIEPFTRTDEMTGQLITANIDAAHNEYLNILFDSGIFALASYLALLAATIASFARGKKTAVSYACAAGTIGYLAEAFFGISTCAAAPYLWMLLAMMRKK